MITNILRLILKSQIWCILENIPGILEKNVYLPFLGGVFCIYLLDLLELQCCSILLFNCWSVWFCSLKVGYWCLQLLLSNYLLLFLFLLAFALYILGFCCLVHICYNNYVFLMDRPFYPFKSPSLSLVIVLVLKSTLSDVSIATPALFGYYLQGIPFFHLFIVNLFVCLNLVDSI